MNNLNSAFNVALSITGFDILWERPGETPETIRVSSSNYSRNMDGPADVIMEGREFIIAFSEVKDSALLPPKRGERLVDESTAGYGINVIRHIELMKGLGGEIIGYRVRTD